MSTVSHELRTPVFNIKIAIQVLKIAPTVQDRERYLEILGQECERAIELINDLLDLQRLEAAAYSISSEIVNLDDWLPSIIKPFQMRTQERQQILRVELLPPLPSIISDSDSLERILAELLNNACKYTPNGGKIVLNVYHEARVEESSPTPSIVFSIRDQAEIPTTQLPRIFEKFYRAPSSDRWKQGGTGLGLALVQKLVKEMEGTIKVESIEGWTTFTVVLPTLHSSNC